jgi:hypothetical protein
MVLPVYAQSPCAVEEPATRSVEAPRPEKRLFGVLPNYRTVEASVPFARLTPRQKVNIARHDSFDWPTFALSGVLTLATPGRDATASFGTGIQKYANLYVRSSADQFIGNMMTEGFLPVILRKDPRYFRQGTGTFWFRLRSALTQVAVAHNDSGHLTLNTPEFLGNAMAVGISTAYYPNLQSWSHRNEKFVLMISTDTFSNVVKEFGPDLKQKFLHGHRKTS